MVSVADNHDVNGLAYVDVLALIRETNRCPGGKRTVRRIVQHLGIDQDSDVLEIGCNTGFTSLELVKISGCRAHGIDISSTEIAEAERAREKLPPSLQSRVSFSVGDARAIDAPDSSYDVIVCGGANSFIPDLQQAMNEYHRVLRPFGYLSVTNLYYREPPPEYLVSSIADAIGAPIKPLNAQGWLERFLAPSWELYELGTFPLTHRPEGVVEAYVEQLIEQPHLASYSLSQKASLRERLTILYKMFNENHKYLGYMFLLLRRQDPEAPEQPELFLEPGQFDRFFGWDFVR